jgi:hypothetical protein
MNPAKRKKLLRFKLEQEKLAKKVEAKPTEVLVEKAVLVIKEETSVVQEQQTTLETSNVELALKPIETVEVTEAKKEKKKKWSSQDA